MNPKEEMTFCKALKTFLGCFGQICILLVVVAVLGGACCLPLAMHKQSLEHITGHQVSWWDAYWTK